jgi:hypothetical protein
MAGCLSAATPEATMALMAAERADCPGKIVCPITGELICADQCPAGEADPVGAAGMRSCCAGNPALGDAPIRPDRSAN